MLSTSGQGAAKAYQKLDTESRIDTASPHRLIQLMMERALARIGLAREQLKNEMIAERGNSISAAISIISGLQASLNHKADQRMSENFDALYSYMTQRLLEANLHSDDGGLREVADLLGEIKEAWDAIADEVEGD